MRELILLALLLVIVGLVALYFRTPEAPTPESPICVHLGAVEVCTDNDLDRGSLVAWWCADCETQLAADFKPAPYRSTVRPASKIIAPTPDWMRDEPVRTYVTASGFPEGMSE